MARQCEECGERVIGRADKKFCSDACRNAFNNALNKDNKNLVRNINNRLRKNYRILETLNTKDKTKVKKTTLQKRLPHAPILGLAHLLDVWFFGR